MIRWKGTEFVRAHSVYVDYADNLWLVDDSANAITKCDSKYAPSRYRRRASALARSLARSPPLSPPPQPAAANQFGTAVAMPSGCRRCRRLVGRVFGGRLAAVPRRCVYPMSEWLQWRCDSGERLMMLCPNGVVLVGAAINESVGLKLEPPPKHSGVMFNRPECHPPSPLTPHCDPSSPLTATFNGPEPATFTSRCVHRAAAYHALTGPLRAVTRPHRPGHVGL